MWYLFNGTTCGSINQTTLGEVKMAKQIFRVIALNGSEVRLEEGDDTVSGKTPSLTLIERDGLSYRNFPLDQGQLESLIMNVKLYDKQRMEKASKQRQKANASN